MAIVTGIFPPDAGGPATHAADLAEAFRSQGHEVTVVTLVDGTEPLRAPGLVRFPRAWSWPRRLALASWWLRANRARYDVIYATGMHEVAAVGGRLAGRPLVAKVVGDPVWERACRKGLTAAPFDEFQQRPDAGLRIRAMTAVRNASLRSAATLIAPSQELVELVRSWTGNPAARVVHNGVRLDRVPSRARPDPPPPLRLISVCRLVAHKRLDAVLEAVALVRDVTFEVVGDGPEAGNLRQRALSLGVGERVRFLGQLSHAEALEHLAGAHALVVASDYEGLPHTAIEALACGTPVVAVPVGGLREVVEDGVTGLVTGGDPPALAAAFARLRDDGTLERTLAEGVAAAAARWSFDRCRSEIESLLREAVAAAARPRAVFVGKSALRASAPSDLDGKLEVLGRHLDSTILTMDAEAAPAGQRHTVLAFPRLSVFGSAAFYALGGALGVALASRRGSGGVVCQSPYEAASAVAFSRLVPRSFRPDVVVEVHGDWRTAARLYGGSARRVLAPLADRVAAWALRRADQVRTVGDFTDALVDSAGYRGDRDRYVAFSDYRGVLAPEPVALPPPEEPVALFVGALERYKGVDVLLEAWALVRRRVPSARLVIAGTGSRQALLTAQAQRLGVGEEVRFTGSLPRPEVAELLDASSLLVLPSRSEGLGRVILEAHARGRPVVASAVGGIPELVEPGRTGLLVEPGSASALAEALIELLLDRTRQAAMGAEGRRRVLARDPQAEFEAGIARLAGYLGRRSGRRC